ncbi:transcription antitermination factor NusB [Tannerella forsythia KS16]|uniref:transcription antitermination factor NusB n=1 Tax=Tannerella forsythia TaxID=28112 RepID=UPI000618D75F|nr:transcription antitermination factor NusB [Tannerella forsythia]KKY61121.1 nitrogen utilization protein [Tannerella forsythia]OLQ21844.1 transcription antitermination factor NusB [Tannerella forsythia]TPE17272.1 transcription antitermination factor NusB [Tannerella forsythia]BAR50522.1 transcription antitermination factor NusB [Tannerella forsythia KS16]
MINRVLIRIKVLQIVFAYYQNGSDDLKMAENELFLSLRRSYDLYYYFLLLIVEVTRLHERQLDTRKHKYLPTSDELNPNMRLVNNRLARQIEANGKLQAYVKEHGVSWVNETDFVKRVLELILNSELYAEYKDSEDDSYETDREFWRAVFRKLICRNEELENALEDISIYWNDDIEIIQTFVIKTIKRFEEAHGSRQELLPMFKDEEDRDFAIQLFRKTLLYGEEYRERIDRHLRNWESERVANMDLYIMQMALAELLHFPNIPVNVTLNEYIDAAKAYSTPKSGTFINGILDSIVQELAQEKLLFKA